MTELDNYGGLLLEGLWLNITVALVAMAGAVVSGLVVAMVKVHGSRLAQRAMHIYTTVFRGVPELVLLLLVYYGFPTLLQDTAASFGWALRVNLDPFAAGVVTLSCIYGAFASEVFRAAYQSVPRGQFEVAAALGLGSVVAHRVVIFPQMMRLALPGLGNVWMVVIKATALISVIQLPELMRNADLAARATRMPFTFYGAACVLYLLITALSMVAQARAESWANRGLVR
jgi:polar amino acid transport system permease protein/arginine/ornithine transport system permease protein